MRNLKLTFLIFSLLTSSVFAQIEKPTTWTFKTAKTSAKVGEEIDLIFSAKIQKGWHLYSNGYVLDPGPLPMEIKFNKSNDYELIGGVRAIGDKTKYDDIFEGNVKYFNGTAEFRQKIKVLKENPTIEGKYEGQVCTDTDGRCVSISGPFSIKVNTISNEKVNDSQTKITTSFTVDSSKKLIPKSIEITDSSTVVNTNSAESLQPETSETSKKEADTSLWAFFIQAFLAGLIALLTPCVYPIIPMTVSYFTKQKRGIPLALLYGLFIVLIYVLFGTVIAFLFGQAAPNFISTHWLPNLIFFAIFLFFGLSFLGWFDLTLPSGLVNKMDAQADRGGLAGIFFMAFTLVLVSFSCTGPIAGTILGLGAQGQVIKPVVGMLGYSLAFAIPFTLFAIFPHWMQSLPKSGGWLNTVKVVLGFLELALALKFLSVADQVYHWHILDREVYIALWIAIFLLLGLYLIGKITLPHDSKTESISVPRLLFAIASFAFVAYLTPGLWGAPLKGLSGWLPPMTTFDSFGTNVTKKENPNKNVKYGDLFKLPHGLKGYFDYQEALAAAKLQNKPIFIDFTGHGCVNCRKMEENVWVDDRVLQKLKADYIVLALYVDDKTEKPENEWYTSTVDGAIKKTIGAQNLDFQITKFNGNAQPYYCLVDPQTEKLIKEPKAYDTDVEMFLKFLNI